MNLQVIKQKWIELISKANANGIPLPMVRDPKTGRGDVALTLVVMSSALVMIGLMGKWSGKLGGIDVANALQFFYASSGLYWARKLSTDGKKTEIAAPESQQSGRDPKDPGAQ